MIGRLRLLVAAAIAFVPVGRLRIALYRSLLGYRIGPGCRIGMFNLACRRLHLGPDPRSAAATSSRATSTRAGPPLFMGNRNVVTCPGTSPPATPAAATPPASSSAPTASSTTGTISTATAASPSATEAGSPAATALYTHGIGAEDRDIRIGRGCFIGSAARFAPGLRGRRPSVVGMGSVVVDRIGAEAALVPAAALSANLDALAAGLRFAR